MLYVEFDYDLAALYIEDVKKDLGIKKPNDEMTDAEIRQVIRKIADESDSTTHEKGKEPDYGTFGIDLMLTLALHFWPKFYQKYELSQNN
jgi:hypothetical protein